MFFVESACRNEIGRVVSVGPYTIVKSLVHGKFSQIFLAENGVRETVAIKLIPIESCNGCDSEDIFDLFPEIGNMKKINHPNVICLEEVFFELQPPNGIFLVTEFMDRGPLMVTSQLSPPAYCYCDTGGVMEEATARLYFRQIFSAMIYVHDLGIAHRDLKVENILISSNGVCKICDFGSSKYFECKCTRGTNQCTCHSQKCGSVQDTVGTWHYWAPEMCNCEDSAGDIYDSFACDVWACAVCLYVCLAGRLPFWANSESPFDIFSNIAACHGIIFERGSANLQKLLKLMTTVDPCERICFKDCFESEWCEGQCSIASFKPFSLRVFVAIRCWLRRTRTRNRLNRSHHYDSAPRFLRAVAKSNCCIL